ncbi:uncharacterized protein KIAA0513-like [Paramacrobiotus metropolitanus]|uniref:uncharacterized protein KIAA0513-like n=1 Tax=Paramacrobiotus metropolitanus TaxID=2943436 RepID=UPI0024460B5F|nr:uncharacterized protein KIAA0513-like [Paramacrobiotus metropolitanus]
MHLCLIASAYFKDCKFITRFFAMTFFLMRNKFHQQPAGQNDEDNATEAAAQRQSKPSSLASGGGLLNALFGNRPSSPRSSERKSSRASSNASSPSRASSSGRSLSFPPKRISFDELDFGAGTRGEQRGGGGGDNGPDRSRGQTASHSPRVYAAAADNRPDDHSSGTTDPPDDNDALDQDVDRASTRSDRGSDTSGPDSPDEAHTDDDLVMFMRQFVEQIFQASKTPDQNEKNTFGEYVRTESGRLWFARFINSQRINYGSKVDEGTFYRLVQYCAIVLFECYQEEDYGAAKILMNICFTFYKEVPHGPSRKVRREFLYHHLRKQAIWHSLKFWNAAYFDATQAERAKRAQREQWTSSGDDNRSSREYAEDDFIFRTLKDFLNNMRAFQVSKEAVSEFLRKQSNNITSEQFQVLRNQVESMYR